MLRRHALRRSPSRAVWVALAATWAVCAGVPARADSNQIERVTVATESRDSVTFNVFYKYSGDRGANVFMSVVMAEDGKPSGNYAYRPGPVQRGGQFTRVTLGVKNGAPPMFSTNQLRVAMYVGGGQPFVERGFSFPKTWTRADAALPPVLETIAGASGGDGKMRRVLPNGHIVLRLSDGTIRERFLGGETVTHPDGSHQTVLYSSAQPPTPPSAPPDETHAAWLDSESKRLLGIIRTLVDNDDASVEHYLLRESADMSAYQRINSRTDAVDMLVRP